jgi:predicted Zn-dependent peptidase
MHNIDVTDKDTQMEGRFEKTVLDNGLRVVTEQVPYVRSVSLGAWVQVGSRDELSHERGISHFLEHMFFKGTARRNAFDIANSLESLGGSLDAFTYRDLTCLYARVLDEDLEVALDVLADMLLNSSMEEREIEKEKRVVLEEIQNVEDTPDDLIHDLFAESIWGTHPVGAPILGTPRTVKSFNREVLAEYLARRYRPERIVLAAAGNLTHDHVVALASRLFNSLPPSAEPYVREIPGDIARADRHVQRDIGQTHIVLGARSFAYTHPRQYDLMVANTALGGGMTSRLFQQVRENLGLAYAVYSYLEAMEDTGLFSTYVACDGKRMDRALDVLKAELGVFGREGITDEELRCSKAQLRGELILGFESVDRRMSRIAREEIYTGRYHRPDELLSAIDRVTRDGVLEVSADLLAEDRLHQVTVGP